jgi:hypothetical protein
MKWLRTLGHPFAIGVEGFLAAAMLFVAADPGVLHPNSAPLSAQSDAIYRDLIR